MNPSGTLPTSLSRKLNELAILVTGREWTAQYEWYAHYKMAMDAGRSPAIADAIARDQRPTGMEPDEEASYDFYPAMHRTRRGDGVIQRGRVAA